MKKFKTNMVPSKSCLFVILFFVKPAQFNSTTAEGSKKKNRSAQCLFNSV